MGKWASRGGLAAVLSSVMAPALVLASPGNAMAFVPSGPPVVPRYSNGVPLRLAVPSSVVGSLDTATAVERARMVGNTLAADVTGGLVPAASTAQTLTKSGAAFAAASGLSIGWSLGSGIAQMMGLDPATSAVKQLLGMTAAPTYVPNTDVGPLLPPGWTSSPYVGMAWEFCGSVGCNGSPDINGTLAPDLVNMPAYGQTTATTITIGTLGSFRLNPFTSGSYVGPARTTQATQVNTNSWYVQVYDQLGNLCAGKSWPSNVVVDPGQPEPDWVGSVTCANGFDHVQMDKYSTPSIYWYPPGSPSAPPPPNGNPSRIWETRSTCSDASTVVAQSVAFTETDTSWPAVPPGKCAGGLQVDHVEVWEVVPTDHTMDTKISTWDRPLPAKTWATTYPSCLDGSCQLDLLHKDSTGALLSCFTSPAPCVGWMTDVNKATDYQCMYGPTAVALSECYAYGSTFDPAINTQAPYADPATGLTPDPGPQPTADTSCWPSGWGVFNPASWVLQPIKCAFIPSPSTWTTSTQTVRAAFDKSPLGEIHSATSNLGAAITPPSGQVNSCAGYGIPMSTFSDAWPSTPAFTPFYSCDGPGKTVADFVSPFLVGGLWLGAIGSTVYVVGSSFGVKL